MAQTFTLVTRVLKAQQTVAGEQIYWGGELHEIQGQGHGQGHGRLVGTFGAIMDTITNVTNVLGMDTSLFKMQLFFPITHGHGGHGGQGGQGGQGGHPQHGRGQAPETVVLEGANEFEGTSNQAQPRRTERAKGSVSAASQQFAQLKDRQFTLENDKLTIL
jgi:hypothetical protein